ncbi:class I SAM-dependent methyltransferase [Nonomuraea sp. NPDC046802]|uniref:class I SAM-dependent methyltransferase n=1 Tax=Nonomuraea sp. NPDC046802 TaxID=3154919 RepID=UPI0033DD365D
MGYGNEHAELYDIVFLSRGKSWEKEAELLGQMIKSRNPAAASLLDVACGTGAHLEYFVKTFAHVEGVEPAEAMREEAEARLSGPSVHAGDMRTFDLGRTFDAVTCLGFAVGYMTSQDELDTAISRMAAHLSRDGVLIVEPWWSPERFIEGYVGGHMVHEPNRVISRITHSTRQGNATRMTIHFVVAQASGIREFHEVEVVTLFTDEEYTTAFERAGLNVERLPGPADHPGYLVGRRR